MCIRDRPNTPGRYKMYVDVKDSTGTVKTAMFQMSVGLSGIDVSSWQGTIDWKKVKAAGIDYAIIRAGYGKEDIDKQTDSTFVQNIKGAKEAGMPFGLYHFSHASTVEEAKQEANFLLEILETNGVTPDDLAYPIAFDIEGKAVSPAKAVSYTHLDVYKRQPISMLLVIALKCELFILLKVPPKIAIS